MSASFWKLFGIGVVSTIDNLLNKEDVTLEQLFVEDELLNECKYGNKSLLQFVLRPDILDQLFTMLMTPPPETADAKTQRFPQIASEVLCTDGWWDFLSAPLFEERTELIQNLWNYFLGEGPFNSANVSAVSRVCGTFFERLPEKSFNLLPQDTIIDALLVHCEHQAVVELLLKLDITSQTPQLSSIRQWLDSANLLGKLLGKLDPASTPGPERETVAEILLEQITRVDAHQMTSRLENPEIFTTLFSFLLGPSSGQDLLSVFSLVIGLLRYNSPDHYDRDTKREDLPAHIQKILEGLGRFTELLKAETGELEVSHGKNISRIGGSKLKIVELVLSIARLRKKAVLHELVDCGLVEACLGLFFAQPWNNFLHKFVLEILLAIIENSDAELTKLLLTSTNLLTRIGEAALAHLEDVEQPKHVQRGYMGHLACLVESILGEANLDADLLSLCHENDSFKAYLNRVLYATQKRQFCWQTLSGLPEKYFMFIGDFSSSIPPSLLDNYDDPDLALSFSQDDQGDDSASSDHGPIMDNYNPRDDEYDDDEADMEEGEDAFDDPAIKEPSDDEDDDDDDEDNHQSELPEGSSNALQGHDDGDDDATETISISNDANPAQPPAEDDEPAAATSDATE